MKNKNTAKILREYRKKKDLYEKFTAALAGLLESMLKKGYKYYLAARIKEEGSLKYKIERKALKGKVYESLADITDVAGVRIIFYTESDRKKFTRKLKKEFGNSLRIKPTAKMSGYRSIHALVSLDPKRLRLPEYEPFGGLEAEVQLSLILEHAWAEIEHDILYKENWGFRKLNPEQYIYMKERMSRIMENYIEKASDELERTVNKFRKLKRQKNF